MVSINCENKKSGTLKMPKFPCIAAGLLCCIGLSTQAAGATLVASLDRDADFPLQHASSTGVFQSLQIEGKLQTEIPPLRKIKSRKLGQHHQRLNKALNSGSKTDLTEAESRLRSAYQRAQNRKLSIAD